MPIPFASELAFRLWDARSWARTARDPAFWLARLDEVEQLAQQNGDSADRLVDLLRRYVEEEREYANSQVERVFEGKAAPSDPPAPLVSQMVCVTNCALIALGGPARDALLDRYARAATGSVEQQWILQTLADMGDPELDGFYAALPRDESVSGGSGMGAALSGRHDGPKRKRRFLQERAVTASGLSEFEQIVQALDDPSHLERCRAAEALGDLGGPRAIEPLRRHREDPAESVRPFVCRALARLSDALSA